MSKQSEDYEALIESLIDKGPRFVTEALIGKNNAIPGLPVYVEYASHVLVPALLRPARFHYAGATPWATGLDAIRDTMDYMDAELKLLQLNHFTAGLLIAKADDQDLDFAKVFESRDFQGDQTIQGLLITEDSDLTTELFKNIAKTLAHTGHLLGFPEREGKETLHVWDLWNTSLKSMAVAMYSTGYLLGSKWKEEEVLKGILQATTKGNE